MLEQSAPAERSAGTSGYLILVVQDEPFERALTARHLRKTGLDVIEVASEEQARRVLDAVHVDIVFADLETPGQANEFSLLRLLYEHHPGAKTILTSGTETDMAAAEGYGTFLRKPYRLADLDSSIERILAATVAKRRRIADNARSRRLRLMLGFALGAVVGSGIANLPAILSSWPSVAYTEQTLAVETVATSTPVAPESIPSSTAQSSPSPGAVMPVAEPTSGEGPNSDPTVAAPGPRSPVPPDGPGSVDFGKQANTRAASATRSAVVETTPSEVPLDRNEVQEIQTRLRSFGFNPGPIDGAVGTRTAEAVMNYQQARGQSQTGTVDRELLERLREDAAPQLAPVATKPDARKPPRIAPRRSAARPSRLRP